MITCYPERQIYPALHGVDLDRKLAHESHGSDGVLTDPEIHGSPNTSKRSALLVILYIVLTYYTKAPPTSPGDPTEQPLRSSFVNGTAMIA